jgi:uncharacterized protein DUF998
MLYFSSRVLEAQMDKIASHHDTASRSATQTLLLSCGILASVFFTTTYLFEGALHPGYDLVRQTISSLELVSNGWTQQVNFIVFGLLISCFAVGIRKELSGGFGATAFPILQVVVALGLIISGIFVADPLHTIGDYISFLALIIGFFVIARRFAQEPDWGLGWVIYSIASAFLMMGFLAIFGTALTHGGPAGLFERLAGLVRSIWTILLVGRLLSGTKFSPPS